MAIDFPDSPSLNDTYVAGGKTYKWDGTAWEIYGPNFNPDILYVDTTNNRVGVNNTSPTVDLDVTGNVNISGELTSRGYRYVDTLYFTSSGTFTKASYPWLRAVRVKCQGAGGGGGGTDECNVGEAAAAPGGGGGCYAESFITDIASLAASVTVTVGAGGAGGGGGNATNSATATAASAGGDSSFGAGAAYEVSAGGGNEGSPGRDGLNVAGQVGTSARRVGTGDLIIGASATEHSFSVGTSDAAITMANGGAGGSSVFGGGGRGARRRNQNDSQLGTGGALYGGGGGGAATTAQSVLTDGADGGTGADGIVIVELYA